MVKRKVNLANVSGWAGTAAGAFNAHTVLLDIPVGPRYHVIWIYGNAGAAKKFTDLFNEIRIKVNGRPQRTFTAIELLKLNALNGIGGQWAGRNGNLAATNFYVPIWFAEPWRKSLVSQDALAWGTGDVSTFQIELDVQAYGAAAAGLIAPTFKAEVDNSLVGNANGPAGQQPLGIITKWQKFQIPITAANAYNEFGGYKDLNGAIQSIHLTDANIADFELIVDNSMIRKDTTAGNAATLSGREMNPDPAANNDYPLRGMYDLVMDHDDVLANALPLQIGNQRVGSCLLRLNESGGTVSRNISSLVQVIGSAE